LFQLPRTAGFEAVAVPRKGGADAVKALIVGEVDFIITPAFLLSNSFIKSK
jgi:tripartite-type tricarboxylate transporter receptor subunit TctC